MTDLPAVLSQAGLVLVEFWTPDCLFSRLFLPLRTRLAGYYGERLSLRRCRLQDGELSASPWGVAGVPALVLFQDGRPVRRWVGEVHVSVVIHAIDARLAEAGTKSTEIVP
ncbi:putative Thioredoxin [Paraburkholderia ribeironis]|uniref:Putative Thioredoxin n=1 Tax=Paraburkholderia ribeironis TaxID=1247936 RepID=A0A1N7S758_9BURK|nr:thioredoxin domain-containing protein [Paraburkholderia ribeironis]SIT43203.1 putative Thioredoxin [Paraburkholderia ribeironis]